MTKQSETQFSISKQVSISMIIALALQTVAVIGFITTLRNDVDNNRERMFDNASKIKVLETLVQQQAVGIARIDENIKAIREMAEFWSNNRP